MTVTDRTEATHGTTAAVRICDKCGRTALAEDKKEYTAARARLVVERGLCVCPAPAPGNASLI